jgi:hypothetical protein
MIDADKVKIRDMVQDLLVAMSDDGESGAHWLNNAHAERWAMENRFLLEAIHKLAEHVKDWGGE